MLLITKIFDKDILITMIGLGCSFIKVCFIIFFRFGTFLIHVSIAKVNLPHFKKVDEGYQFQMIGICQKYVFWLQISMHKILTMDSFQA